MTAVTFHDAKAYVCDPKLMLFDTPEWISLTLREIVERRRCLLNERRSSCLNTWGRVPTL